MMVLSRSTPIGLSALSLVSSLAWRVPRGPWIGAVEWLAMSPFRRILIYPPSP